MGQLGDEQRALIELSMVRGVSDEEIAGYLGIDPGLVRERREAALHAVATASGDGSEAGRRRVVAHLRGDEAAPMVAERERVPDAVGEPAPEPERQPRRRMLGPLLIGAALLAVAAALVVSLRHRGDSAPTGDAAAPAPPARAPAATLKPLAGGPARGAARLVNQDGAVSLKLSVRGLPTPSTGGYVIWLYDSVSDARSLTGSLKGNFKVDMPLPRGYRRYRYLDISREPADGNRNHSGQSVLRVPLASLRVAGQN